MRFLARSLLVICLIIPLYAQAQVAEGPAMWRLETENTTITFLGSLHIVPPSTAWQGERVTNALLGADSVVFEVDLLAAEDPAFVQQMLAAGSLPQGETLEHHLTVENYAKLSALCAKVGLSIAAINGYRPWFVGTMISVLHMQALGYSPEAGVDFVLDKMARSMGKTIGALESLDDQMTALISMGTLSEDDFIKEVAREFDEPDYLQSMFDAWFQGDIGKLTALTVDELQQYPELYDAMYVNRNSNWMVPLEELIMAGGKHFVIVGAGHLIGEDSVINMLRAKGYTVERF